MPHKLLPSRFLVQRLPAALEGIRRHFCDFGCSPSFSELAARIGVDRKAIRPIVKRLADAGLINWTPGVKRSITLPRSLSMHSSSELLWELQARGNPVSLGRTGDVPPIASAWPEAAVVDVNQVPKVELELLARLSNIA